MTLKELAALYDISETTFWRYRKEWEEAIDKAAKRYTIGNKTVKKKDLSKEQIKIIVALMNDPPEGYKIVRGLLIKIKTEE
jgi:hypothetical protein